MFTFLSNLSSGFTSFTALLASFAGPRLQALAANCQNPSCACKSIEFGLGNCTVDDNHQGKNRSFPIAPWRIALHLVFIGRLCVPLI